MHKKNPRNVRTFKQNRSPVNFVMHFYHDLSDHNFCIFFDPEIINAMKSATNLILNECYFRFNSKIYKQL